MDIFTMCLGLFTNELMMNFHFKATFESKLADIHFFRFFNVALVIIIIYQVLLTLILLDCR